MLSIIMPGCGEDGVDQEKGSEALHSVNVLSSCIGLELVEI